MRSWKATRVALGTLLLLGLLGCHQPAPSTTIRDQRPAFGLESAYVDLAAHLGSPKICEKIHPGAYDSDSFMMDPDSQVWYTRSKCYFNLALATRDLSYCDKVIQAESWFIDGSSFTPEECKAAIAGKGSRSHLSSADEVVLLQRTGYPKDQITQHASLEFDERCFRYTGARSRPDQHLSSYEFRNRIRFLPDYTAGDLDLNGLLALARQYDEAYRKGHVNDLVENGRASIHVAAARGDNSCIAQLIELGASVSLPDKGGATALDHATESGHDETVRFLLEAGGDAAAGRQTRSER